MKRTAEISTGQLHADIEASTTSDLSILRKPIKTSVTGLSEARKAYKDGTEEVRKLLANECDIIYECKVCRNIFRSLANFISHKRIYCKTTFSSSLQFNFHNDSSSFSQDISTIVQAENEFIGASRNGKGQDKDLSSIIERLVKRETASRVMKLSDFYEQVNSKLTQDELMQKRNVLRLDVVPESSVAVYQTVKAINDDGDNIKTEVTEVEDLMAQDRTILGPDGKIVSASDLPKYLDDVNKPVQSFECEICSSKFATEKTLKLHIEAKHIPSTYVFQCPSCSKTFLQVGQVIRHLTNDHKKSMRRVRLMRDSIFKRRTRIDEVQVKGPSRELARLQTDKERTEAQNKAWFDNLENNDSSASICTYCGKKFERRAVLLSHTKVCQLKKKTNNSTSLTKKSIQTITKEINTNGWNARDYDESSNSNSVDTALMDESSMPSLKTEKLIKTEPELDITEPVVLNKRKRNRTSKAVVKEGIDQGGSDKSLNICWNMDADTSFEVKEESVSPNAELDLCDSESNLNTTTWNIIDPDTQMNICTIEEVKSVMEDDETELTSGDQIVQEKESQSKCKYCGKKFSNPSNLRRHVTMLHLRPRKFACTLCKVEPFRAHRKIDVFNHMRTKHLFEGEKTDALKYISVKEEVIPKPAPSINRRKEKHTEVLKDDEPEIIAIIESDPLTTIEEAVSTSSSANSSNENSNVDLDDGFLNRNGNEMADDILCNENGSSMRRKGRPKATSKDVPKKVERSLSLGDTKESQALPARRPVRNRTMPVKKDFVYDLSNLLKKEAGFYKEMQQQQELQKQQQQQIQIQQQQHQQQTNQIKSRNPSPTPTESKTNKRRNTIPSTPVTSDSEQQPNVSPSKEEINSAINTASDTESITGAANVMAKIAVKDNRAVFFQPPELPAERPIKVTIKSPTQRQFDPALMKNWPILKRPSHQMYGALKSKAHRSPSSLKNHGMKRRKRSCLLKRAAKKTLLMKISGQLKVNGNGHSDIECKPDKLELHTPSPVKISSKIADKIQLQYAQKDDENVKLPKLCEIINARENLVKKIHKVPDTTTRRMTLLERLAENKTKKLNESLSRMSIGKSDIDANEQSD